MPLVDMVLTLQNVIDGPPEELRSLFAASCSGDEVTVNTWESTWREYCRLNSLATNKFEHTVMEVAGSQANKPVILALSGPSLRKNFMYLKECEVPDIAGNMIKYQGRGNIPIVSCLHNFNFFEDNDVMGPDDFYVTLDSGEICIREIYEGGSHDPKWYWDRTKDRTLVAYTGTSPELINRWQGKILWFTTPPQSVPLAKFYHDYIDYARTPCYNVGGTVAGAALYHARAILGAGVTIVIGADFCFGYDHKFHAWDSNYDKKFSGVIPWVDIFGNRVWTWGSYLGFKKWFDFIACGGQGGNQQLIINCTEGGIFGSYAQGNIKQVMQWELRTALHVFSIAGRLAPSLLTGNILF